jgi:hypothetical protein
MSITYIPFESKSGFKSPNFSVDENGNVIVSSLTVQAPTGENEIRADAIYIKGIQLLEGSTDESTLIALGNEITASSLTRVGTLEYLNIDGDLRISQGSTPYFNVVDGHIEMTSFGNVGTIDNVAIGTETRASGSFTTATANDLVVEDQATLNALSVTTNITVTNSPTAVGHVTRKDYVDSRISAFAIAFGA